MANVGGLDPNSRRTLSALSSSDNTTIVNLWADPTTHRLLVDNANTAAALAVGTTTITGGTTTRILYDNAGVLGEYTLSGSGTAVAMATSPTFATSITGSYLDASEILITDGSKNIVSAPVATYPSLTELTYVKGVTSSIQTQINAKGTGTVTAVSVATANGVSGSSSGGATPALTITLGAITPTTVNGNTFTTGSSTYTGTAAQTYTFPTTSASIARTDAGQTFTGVSNATSWNFTTPVLGTPTSGTLTNCTGLPAASVVAGTLGSGTFTTTRLNFTNNAITASGNAATVPITSSLSTVTNNSAATLTITMTTTSAVDGQMTIVRIYDFSGVAQTLTLVNTENSTVTAPTTTNGSTTLPLTLGFMFNSATTKWRLIASA